jgi:hypothetical protein
MSITSMAGRLFTVYRRTALVLDSAAIVNGSSALTRQPAANALVSVAVAGATVHGTVTVNGDVGGVPTAEVLTFTGDGTLTTAARFDAGTITTLDFAGWTGGTVEARAVGGDGSRIHGRYAVATSVRCHLNRGRARWPNTVAGTAEIETTWLAHDWTTAWAPREGDVYVDQGSGEQWRVEGDPNWLGSLRPHHWEVRVKRREGSLDT